MAKGIKGAAQVSDTHQGGFKKKSSKPGTSPRLFQYSGSYGSMLFTKWLDPMMKSKELPVALYKVLQIFLKMIPESQLDSDVDADAVPVLCLEHAQRT